MATIENPLRTAEGYFKRAYRIALRARHPAWKEAVLRRNLAFLWASRTQAEEEECEQLRRAAALTLPAVDERLIMERSVEKGWVKLEREGGGTPGATAGPSGASTGPSGAEGIQPGVEAGSSATVPAPTVATPPTQPLNKVNTTSFAFWPQGSNLAYTIPNFEKEKLEAVFKVGTLLSPTDDTNATWHGARELGEGAAGRVSLWLQTDESNRVIDRMAIKDTKPVEHAEWVDPTKWRDQLPREIAISQRLAAQGHPGIIGFRGHRLNMADRISRLYLDYSDYGSVMDVLMEYYYEHGTAAARALKDKHRKDASKPAAKHMPEAFIWHVFKSLVDMLVVLRDGTGQALEGGREWKPIVHLDICLSNLLAGPGANEAGTPIYPDYKDRKKTKRRGRVCRVRDRAAWPRIVMTDFDTSMFDLQDGGDAYQDNPVHYTFPWPIDDDSDEDGARGRYPPERSNIFYQQRARLATTTANKDVFAGEEVKFTSAADIWSVAQVIWCLLTNLSFGQDFRPKFDAAAKPMAPRVHLSDGLPYTAEHVSNNILTGDEPYEVTRLYSDEIKELVRECFAWDPSDRVPLDELKRRVDAGWMARGEDKGKGKGKGKAKEGDGPDEEMLLMTVPSTVEEYAVGAVWTGKKRKRSTKDVD